MGINGCHNYIYKSIELSIDHLKEVIYMLSKENAREDDKIVIERDDDDEEDNNEPIVHYKPCIIIDANNVGFRNCTSPETYNMLIAKSLRALGAKVVLAADNNEERHFSKRASSARRVKREVARIKSIQLILKMAGLDDNAKVILHNEKAKKHSLKRVISETIERVKRVKKMTIRRNNEKCRENLYVL